MSIIRYENYIPVKKDNKWGFINLSGKVVINLQYDDLGCVGSNPSSNVLIIPEIKSIVVKKGEQYGIVRMDGKILKQMDLTKVFKETEQGNDVYYMMFIGKKINIVDYMKKLYGDNLNTENVVTNKGNENSIVINKN